jgi:Septin
MDAADVLNQDRRIHCLFYFFAAHSVRDIDLSFLAQLSGTVPIIPVVAKADTMTNDERNQYLSDLHQTIQDLSLSLNTPVTYDFNAVHTGSDSQAADLPRSSLDKNSNASKSGRRSRSPRHSFAEISDDIEYSSGETSLESHLHTSHLYANTDFDLDPSYSSTDYTYKNTSCAPSPEFVALISQSTEFGEGTGSVSSDDGNLLHETPMRRLSMCSMDSNENIADLNSHVTHSDGAPDRNMPTPDPDSPASWRERAHGTRSKIDRELSYNYGDDNSPDDDSNVETLFDKETFVNIGRALSDNAIYRENHSSGSSEANSRGAKDVSISSFEECDDDDEFEGSWSVLMDSAVLVGLPFEDGPSHLKGSQKTASPTAKPPHHRANDDSESSLDIPVPVEKMICKLVTSKICDSIAGEGERKICKLVSKYVCEKLVAGTSPDGETSDLDHSGMGHQEREYMVTEAEEAERKSHGVSPLSTRKNSVACEAPASPRDNGVIAPHADCSPPLTDSTSLEGSNLPPFTISPGGRHIYTNIFAIANKKSALPDIKMEGRYVAGAVDDDDSLALQTQSTQGPDSTDLPLPPSPVHFSASASPVRHSVQWAKASHSPCSEDNSDMVRLQMLIFQGMVTCICEQDCRCSLLKFPLCPGQTLLRY